MDYQVSPDPGINGELPDTIHGGVIDCAEDGYLPCKTRKFPIDQVEYAGKKDNCAAEEELAEEKQGGGGEIEGKCDGRNGIRLNLRAADQAHDRIDLTAEFVLNGIRDE